MSVRRYIPGGIDWKARNARDEAGVRVEVARYFGLQEPCRCGHINGLHELSGKCVALGCECNKFVAEPM